MNKVINLKGTIGDSITVTVDDEDTNYCTIKFDDSMGGGLKSLDQLPALVENMNWKYASMKDKEEAERIYNTEISNKRIFNFNKVNSNYNNCIVSEDGSYTGVVGGNTNDDF